MKRFSFLYALVIATIIAAIPLYAQEAQDTGQEKSASATATVTVQEGASEAPEAAGSAVQDTEKAKEIAIYGEVQTVNAASNSMSVQYYDYDSDEEKTITLITNNDTKFENAALLNDIKKGDWVDVTYVLSDAKFLAKLVTVEKEEDIYTDKTTPNTPPAGPAEEE